MKRNFLYSAIAIATLSANISAYAATPVYKGVFKDAVPCCRWTGFYVGASLGDSWDRVKNSLSVVNNTTSPYFFSPAIPGVNASGSTTLNSTKLFIAAQGGYNYQWNKAVFGLEGAFNLLSNTNGKKGTYRYTTNNSSYFLRTSTSANWLFSLRPRVGWTFYDALLYVSGGWSLAQFKYSQLFTEVPFTPTPEIASSSRLKSGWNIGAGAEYLVTCNWTVRADYSFNRFGTNTTNGVLTSSFGNAYFSNKQDHRNIHLLSFGVNYIFA